jgi:hypothetical protein
MNFPYNLVTSCTSIEEVNLPHSHIGKKYFINTGIVTFLTHILCVSLESWVTDGWNTSFDFLWTFLITFSQLALLLSRSTELTVRFEKIYYINTWTITFLTHIFCDSYWIIGGRRMDFIYWLLMNFPDTFLTTCTSIEKVNLPSSNIGKIYYINTRIVTFLTHILCDSYWIMGDGQMGYINRLHMNFPDNFLTACTSIKKVNLPPSHIGKIYDINTGIVIFLTHILCLSLESWVTDRWNTSIDFLWTFLIICSWVALLLRWSTYLPVTLGKYITSTRGKWHS